jgi:hypothetical protein
VNFTDTLILALAVTLVVFTVVHSIRKRKNGGCGCECDDCAEKNDNRGH